MTPFSGKATPDTLAGAYRSTLNAQKLSGFTLNSRSEQAKSGG
jgi:hypothetical protein